MAAPAKRRPVPRPEMPPEVPPAGPVSLLLAPAGRCRWPLWSGRTGPDNPPLVCGAPTAAGCSYCAGHMAQAFDAAPPPDFATLAAIV